MLTKKGRRLLLEDSPNFNVTKASFSDQEINYFLLQNDIQNEIFDDALLELPLLEPSNNEWEYFDYNLEKKVYESDAIVDYIPKNEYRFELIPTPGTSNVFKLNRNIVDQTFEFSYVIIPPNSTKFEAVIPESSIIDMTSFLRYYCLNFNLTPIFPAAFSNDRSPYFIKWRNVFDLEDNVVKQFQNSVRGWTKDQDAIQDSKWIVSNDQINIINQQIADGNSPYEYPFVDIRNYRDSFGRATGITIKLTLKKEHLYRIYQYMNEYNVETILDYIYIVNNDESIIPNTYIYGTNKFNSINKRIPIYITKIV